MQTDLDFIISLAERSTERLRDGWLETVNHYQSPYYRFLYWLAKELGPANILEIGTGKGESVAHLVMGDENGGVLTIDAWPNTEGRKMVEGLPNAELFEGLSTSPEAFEKASEYEPLDIMFVDGTHTYDQVQADLAAFNSLLAPSAVIVFDDLNLDHGGVRRAFHEFGGDQARRVELPDLHPSGFGVIYRRGTDD